MNRHARRQLTNQIGQLTNQIGELRAEVRRLGRRGFLRQVIASTVPAVVVGWLFRPQPQHRHAVRIHATIDGGGYLDAPTPEALSMSARAGNPTAAFDLSALAPDFPSERQYLPDEVGESWPCCRVAISTRRGWSPALPSLPASRPRSFPPIGSDNPPLRKPPRARSGPVSGARPGNARHPQHPLLPHPRGGRRYAPRRANGNGGPAPQRPRWTRTGAGRGAACGAGCAVVLVGLLMVTVPAFVRGQVTTTGSIRVVATDQG